MKAEVKYTYEKADMVALVMAEHARKYQAPQGMKWETEGSLNYHDELEIKAVPIETGKVEEVENG